MSQENPLFEGFQPQAIGDSTTAGAEPQQPAVPTGKKKRKGKKAKPALTTPFPAAAPVPAASDVKKPRKPRAPKAPSAKRSPKFELQAILAATAGLKEADMPGFEKGLNLLLDVNAAGRGRLLAAWAKVFA